MRLELALLSHLFTIAIKEWQLGLVYNPVMNIRKPPAGQGRNRRMSAEEEKTLLETCDQYSNPILGWIVRTALLTGMRAGEITSLRFHDLRHEAVSRLVEAGLGDQEVAAISGHKSLQMLKRYTHLRAEDLVERLDKLMG